MMRREIFQFVITVYLRIFPFALALGIGVIVIGSIAAGSIQMIQGNRPSIEWAPVPFIILGFIVLLPIFGFVVYIFESRKYAGDTNRFRRRQLRYYKISEAENVGEFIKQLKNLGYENIEENGSLISAVHSAVGYRTNSSKFPIGRWEARRLVLSRKNLGRDILLVIICEPTRWLEAMDWKFSNYYFLDQLENATGWAKFRISEKEAEKYFRNRPS